VFEDGLLASLFAGLEFQFAAKHVDDGGEVDDACDGVLLTEDRRAVSGCGRNGLGRGDREARRDARPLIDRRRLTQCAGESRQDLEQVLGHRGRQVRLLRDDAHLRLQADRVVRADLGAEPVLQRCDDATAVGVVLGVRARDHEDVER
jgi:hypothetical protein